MKYNTRMAVNRDVDRVLAMYHNHRNELRFDAVFEFFRLESYLGDKVKLILTEEIETNRLVGCISLVYSDVQADGQITVFANNMLVDREHRMKGISKILSKAAEMKAKMDNADGIIKVAHKSSPFLNLEAEQKDGFSIKASGDYLIIGKQLKEVKT